MSEQENYEEEESQYEGPSARAVGLFLVAPALPVVGLFYLLLRKARLPQITIVQIAGLTVLLSAAAWHFAGATGHLAEAFSSLFSILDKWHLVLLPLALAYIALGAVLGSIITWLEYRKMAKNPHRLELQGSWQYRFKPRRSLRQTLARRKRMEALRNGKLVDEDRTPLGINLDDDQIVSRYYTEAATHTLISGASGSGKTVTMQSLIHSDIVNGVPMVILDFKRSPEFASKVAAWSKEQGCDFYHFVNGTPADYDIKHSLGQAAYDPLSAASATAKADMVLGMREYDTASAVYKANMQQLLQVLFKALKYADPQKAPSVKWDMGGIVQVASAITGDNFTELAIACQGTEAEKDVVEVAQELKGRTGLRHAMEELQGQFRTIISSEYGHWLQLLPGARSINIRELVSQPRNVILFSLNSDSEPEFAKYMGAMILADITNTSAARRNAQVKNKVSIYVDEFQAVNPSSVSSLLEKSRESAMAVTLAQQSFEQVVASAPSNGEAYLLSILDTCSNFIVHNGMTQDSAERLSKILGKKHYTRYRATNQNKSYLFSLNWRNKRESVVNTLTEEDWVFAPRQFMALKSPTRANNFESTAVIISKSCDDPLYSGRAGALARRMLLIPELEVLDTYYDPTFRLDPEAAPVERVATVETDWEVIPAWQERDWKEEKARREELASAPDPFGYDEEEEITLEEPIVSDKDALLAQWDAPPPAKRAPVSPNEVTLPPLK